MAAMSERYGLYLLHLFVEVMTEEMNELMRYGISPLGVGKVRPLNKDLQKKIRPLLEKINDSVREAAVNMIKEAITPAGGEVLADDWIKTMLEELRRQASSVGSTYTPELENINGLLDEIKATLSERDEAHEEK